MAIRKMVKIDEEKCNGCGACVPGCAEGALAIVDGKARLVKESYCDGLGACLGECPQGAISIEERDAAEFDPAAVERHLAGGGAAAHPAPLATSPAPAAARLFGAGAAAGRAAPSPSATQGREAPAAAHHGGCPGSRMMQFRRPPAPAATSDAPPTSGPAQSALNHWPVQLALLPVEAPFYQDAELVLSADCAAFALGDFHSRLLRGRALAIACPKLDDVAPYVDKLTEILRRNRVRGLVLVHMEVPCCGGIVRLAHEAARRSGRTIPARDVTVSVSGEILSDELEVLGGGA
jgi:Pyruvate/2-oxoacid:ferredoxin oxidoreductase delta subunit